jgi:hypothetical protein
MVPSEIHTGSNLLRLRLRWRFEWWGGECELWRKVGRWWTLVVGDQPHQPFDLVVLLRHLFLQLGDLFLQRGLLSGELLALSVASCE